MKPPSPPQSGKGLAKASVLAFLLLPLCASVWSAPIPLLHLAFNEGEGASAADATATNPPAVLKGNATWTKNTATGVGAAISLSGKDGDYVAAPAPKLTGLGQFTLTLWINFQGPPAINDRLLSTLLSGKGIDLRVANVNAQSGQVSLGLDVNGANAIGSDGITAINGWTFVAITYTDTSSVSNIAYYSSGVGQPLGHSGRGSSAGGPVNGSAELQVGGTPTNPSRTPAVLIDDVRIYPGVLSFKELKDICL